MDYYFRNTGSTDWGTAANWSLTDGGGATGAVPTATDNAFFTNNSGNCTLTATNKICLALTTTTFNGTITISTVLTTAGDVTLSATTTINGTGTFSINGTVSATRNGATLSISNSRVVSTGTVTLIDSWDVVNWAFSGNGGILNGSNLNITGNLTLTQATGAGTSLITANGIGSQTWSGNFALRNSLTINKASGDFIISGSVAYSSGIITRLAGNIITTGSTITFSNTGGSASLNVSGVVWNNLNGTQFVVVTLLTDLYCQNVNTLGFNGPLYKVYINGNLTIADYITATAPIYMVGTGTIVGNSTRYLQGALVIDTAGLIIFSGFLYMFGTSSITHINGDTYVPADHTLQIATVGTITTLNCSAIKWSNFILSNSANMTLLDHIYFRGNFTRSSNPTSITGTYNVYIGGNVTIATHVVSTTCTFILNGSGKFNVTATLGAKVIIDTDGIYDLISSFAYGGPEFTVIKGTINTGVYAFQFLQSCIVTNINRLKLRNVVVSSNQTLTMNEFFTGSPENKTRVRITGGTSPYKITFTDTVPKKAFHINVQYCQINNRNQLNIINRDGNAGFNTGILFGDNGIEGFPLNQFPTESSYPFGNGFQSGGMNY